MMELLFMKFQEALINIGDNSMTDHGNKIIGVPELYDMMIDIKRELTEKIDKSDKENKARDEANHNELRNWIKGNGKPGLEERQSNVEQSLKRVWWFVGVIAVSIIGIAFFIVRSGLLS
jgi:hypothetical protein